MRAPTARRATALCTCETLLSVRAPFPAHHPQNGSQRVCSARSARVGQTTSSASAPATACTSGRIHSDLAASRCAIRSHIGRQSAMLNDIPCIAARNTICSNLARTRTNPPRSRSAVQHQAGGGRVGHVTHLPVIQRNDGVLSRKGVACTRPDSARRTEPPRSLSVGQPIGFRMHSPMRVSSAQADTRAVHRSAQQH